LLRIAATHNRPDIVKLLLDFGFDPDERMRFTGGDDPAFSWGMPLQHCEQTLRTGPSDPQTSSRAAT
jgi:hypothetical protein